MKVLIATGIYPPEIGGPATYSKLLADKLPQRGISVDVLAFREVRRFPKVIRHIAYFFRVLKQGKSANIIFAQDPVSVGFPAMLAAKILRKRFFLKVVGDYAWEQGVQRFGVKDSLDEFSKKTSGYRFPVRALKRMERRVAEKAEKIITPSRYLKQILENWGISGHKIHVIYNAFSASRIEESKEELRRVLKLNGKIMISVGRIVPWKGFDLLVELMPELVKIYPDLNLLIVGEGPGFHGLQQKIAALGLADQVKLLGALPHNIVLKYLKAADVFVLNTGYEGFSHQLLEVMASGTSLVTTAVGGNMELIENGKNGILVQYNDRKQILDAIKKLLADATLREHMAMDARKKVGEFSEERTVRETARQLS